MKAELLTYSRSKGLFAGIDLTGTSVTQSMDDTKAYYGESYTFDQILKGSAPADPASVPPGGKGFVHAIARFFKSAQK